MQLLSLVPLLLHSPAPPLARSACLHASAAAAPSPPPPPPLNATDFAGLLEASFVPAVMSLSRGDVTETKLFVAAAHAAHAQGQSLDIIADELAKCPVQSAGRALMPEEDALRYLWLGLTYLSCEKLAGESGQGASEDLVPGTFRAANAELVGNLLDAKAAAKPLSQLSLDDVMPEALRPAAGSMEAAVMTQSLRIVYLTADVLEDVANAGTRADAKTPKPYIPGAS
jgi:hypothetical protein